MIDLSIHTKDKIGNRYGRLTVKSFVRYVNGKSIWHCVCDCGNTIDTRSPSHNKGSKSCGCLKMEAIKTNGHKNMLPKGETGFNHLYLTYKATAKKRGFVFELTKDYFRLLTKNDCFYCDAKPSNVFSTYAKNQTKVRPEVAENSKYTYNGIDRINNDIGYIKSNCVSCCKQCNQAKSNFTLKEFRRWNARVYNRFNK